MEKVIFETMDRFYEVVNSRPSTEAGEALTRVAATVSAEIAIPALAHLCAILATKRKYGTSK